MLNKLLTNLVYAYIHIIFAYSTCISIRRLVISIKDYLVRSCNHCTKHSYNNYYPVHVDNSLRKGKLIPVELRFLLESFVNALLKH